MPSDAVQSAWEIARRSYVSAWRAFNSMLDVAFYDIGSLSGQERSMLSAYAGPEGSVLVVYPRNPGRSIRVLTPAAFVREQLANTSDPVNAVVAQLTSAGMAGDRFIYGSPDSTSLLYLLSKLGSQLTPLVGHSKGNYSIENALEGWLDLRRDAASPVHVDLHVVTLGAVIWFPPEFAHLHQFIGRIDYFGMLNSRVFVRRIGVPGAWHSLNTSLPGHLSVISALESVDVLGELLA
jgi:hypothetical protein